jgi:integrase
VLSLYLSAVLRYPWRSHVTPGTSATPHGMAAAGASPPLTWTDTALVFTTRTGLPVEPRNFNRSFARVCDDNGIRRVKVHVLRHTTASLLKALGVPPKDAQVILGHANASTTNQIYTHVDEAAKREAITRLNRLLGGTDE